ncbi:MAG: hypothetical protein MUF00_14495 [Gemmatimonadaceae bacterium]|jgi:hypothetical protein|nr:hypothetical protein [Gemmatimonadaceae bacterium]
MPFQLGRPPADPVALARVRAWACAAAALDEDAPLFVTQLACAEPGCPPLETVIALVDGANSRKVTVHRAVAEVTQADVERALAVWRAEQGA